MGITRMAIRGKNKGIREVSGWRLAEDRTDGARFVDDAHRRQPSLVECFGNNTGCESTIPLGEFVEWSAHSDIDTNATDHFDSRRKARPGQELNLSGVRFLQFFVVLIWRADIASFDAEVTPACPRKSDTFWGALNYLDNARLDVCRELLVLENANKQEPDRKDSEDPQDEYFGQDVFFASQIPGAG